jgi:hypothetical protein
MPMPTVRHAEFIERCQRKMLPHMPHLERVRLEAFSTDRCVPRNSAFRYKAEKSMLLVYHHKPMATLHRISTLDEYGSVATFDLG